MFDGNRSSGTSIPSTQSIPSPNDSYSDSYSLLGKRLEIWKVNETMIK